MLTEHYHQIHAVCRRLAGNDEDGLDATQEALVAIVKGLPRFDGRAKFTTWAYRVATNAALDELRRRARRPSPGLPEEGRGANPVASGRVAGDPAEPVANQLVLDAALAGLPDDFRSAVVLRDVVGLPYSEIAETLRVPTGTVRSRIARGRARLAEVLSEDRELSDSDGNPSPPDLRQNE